MDTRPPVGPVAPERPSSSEHGEHVLGPGALVGGKYRIERALGRGGMGEVFLAFHEQLGRRVAIKILRADAAEDAAIRARFRREAVAACALASAHIAEVSDVGELPAAGGSVVCRPYMVMEYLQGRDLAAHLAERGTLEVAEVVDLLGQICEGVRVAHAAGVVHRDLKPANLFLVPRGDGGLQLKILDFGIAKAEANLASRDSIESSPRRVAVGLTQLTEHGGMLGSARYMAPEQMESARDVDGRADIWSIGVIGYKLLAGKVPFEAEGLEALFVAMITRPFVPLRALRPDAPSALIEAIEVCLRPNRDERWPTIETLAGAVALARAALTADHLRLGDLSPAQLTRALSHAPTRPQPIPFDGPLAAPAIPPPAPRWPAAMLVVGLMSLSVFALLAFLLSWGFVGPRRAALTAGGAGSAGAVPSQPRYALTDTVVDPVALLPRAQAEASAVLPGPPPSLSSIGVHNAGSGPLRLSGNTMVTFELVRPGDGKLVDITFSATSAFAVASDLGNAVRPLVAPPRCGFEAARTAAVSAGYVPGTRSYVEYGKTSRTVWRFHGSGGRAGTPTVDIDAVTCALVLPRASSFDVARPLGWGDGY